MATDQTLLNLRDAAKHADRSWRAGMRLATALFEVRPEILGAFRLMASFASRLTGTMAARSPFRSPEARVIVIGYGLASASILADQGRRLSVGLRIVSQFAAWLADHKELLRDIETYSEERWAKLMEAPDFPTEVSEFLMHSLAEESAQDARGLGGWSGSSTRSAYGGPEA